MLQLAFTRQGSIIQLVKNQSEGEDPDLYVIMLYILILPPCFSYHMHALNSYSLYSSQNYTSCRSSDIEDRLPVSKEAEAYSEGSIEDDRSERDENEEETDGKSRLVYFLRKWFSYSRLRAKDQGWNGMHQEYALVSQEIL